MPTAEQRLNNAPTHPTFAKIFKHHKKFEACFLVEGAAV